MPVAEVLQRVSHREYKLWVDWFFYDYNRSSKLDEYLKQLTYLIWSKEQTSSNNLTAESFQVRLVRQVPDNRTASDLFKEGLAASKAIWSALLTVGRKKGKENNVIDRQPNRPSAWR